MIQIRKHSRDIDFNIYDYVIEDSDKFLSLLPFLTPKVEGDWHVIIIEPKLAFIRMCLDTEIIPEYLDLVITVEQSLLDQLYLERPNLVEKEKSNWDRYLDMLASFSSILANKTMYEIYRRCGPREDNLRAALDTLSQYPVITMREINKHFAPVTRVYAKQVVQAFLRKHYSSAWKMLGILEADIGSTVAFYAMRKSIRSVFQAKCKYLRNEETTEYIVESVDVYTIILLYWLFESATSPEQLYPILLMFERRQIPC